MIILERTTDAKIIKSIATDPRTWDAISDDHTPKREEYEPPVDGAVYVLVRSGKKIGGMFVLVPRSHVRWEIHTLLLPELSPWRKLEAAAKMRDWVFTNTPCESLVTECPAPNKLAYGFAVAAGMIQFGIEPKCFLKGGVLYDSVWLSMNRPKEN